MEISMFVVLTEASYLKKRSQIFDTFKEAEHHLKQEIDGYIAQLPEPYQHDPPLSRYGNSYFFETQDDLLDRTWTILTRDELDRGGKL